jgi:hypothetical protein
MQAYRIRFVHQCQEKSMNHKKHQTILWSAYVILIGALLLARPALLTQAGPELPSRETPTPGRSPDNGDDKPAGAHIVLQVESAPAGLWSVVQWQDSAGGWHDVEGWRGTLDASRTQRWWVDTKDFGKGPFRWVIYRTQADLILAESGPFYLPRTADETVMIEALPEP